VNLQHLNIFRLLVSLTGVKQGGVQLPLMQEGSAGSIREALDIMRKYRGRVSSVLISTYECAPEGYRKVYIRMSDLDYSIPEAIKKELDIIASILI